MLGFDGLKNFKRMGKREFKSRGNEANEANASVL